MIFIFEIILFPKVLIFYELAFLVCVFLIGFIEDLIKESSCGISIPQEILLLLRRLLGSCSILSRERWEEREKNMLLRITIIEFWQKKFLVAVNG
jgi:hypothetical protein